MRRPGKEAPATVTRITLTIFKDWNKSGHAKKTMASSFPKEYSANICPLTETALSKGALYDYHQ